MFDREKCPSEKMLIDFASQSLTADAMTDVNAHLEICQTCAEAVEWIKCHLLRPLDDDESELTGIGLNSPAEEEPLSNSDNSDQNPQLVDFDFSSLEKSIVDGAIGRLGGYDILGIIGRGGMGVVFKAWDDRLRRTVAIKVLKRSLACSTNSRRRFLREARAAAPISHPNVVTIHAVEEHRDIPFIVMEFVNGHSLRSAIRGGTRLDFTAVLRIGAQVAGGLAAAHAHGVIHRDIKPGNIMLEEKVDRAKITDFGLARAAADNTDLTSCELAVGTPAYMSPEQVTGGPVDSRSDLFGLGCLFYEMVVGHSPFQGRNALEIARKVESHAPQPLHLVQPNVPRFFSDVVTRLLEKEPNDRFQTAAEVAELLSRHLHSVNQAPSDYVPVLPEKTPPEANVTKNRRFTTFSVSIVVVITLLVVCGVVFQSPLLRANKLPNSQAVAGQFEMAGNPASAETLAVLQVAQSGEAPFRSINAALKRATRGTKIVILDDAVYNEVICLDESERWAGLKIESQKQATLRSDSPRTLLTIDSIVNVTISGLKLEAHKEQHAIELLGDCRGTKLENLVVATTCQSGRAAVYLHTGIQGSSEEPLVIEHCVVKANNCVTIFGDEEFPAAWICFQGNRFHGYGAIRDGGGIVLHDSGHHLTVVENTFFSLRRALSLAPGASDRLDEIHIVKNGVYKCRHWLAVQDPVANQGRMVITDNNLAEVKGLEIDDDALDQISKEWFACNIWEVKEKDQAVDRDRAVKVAVLSDHIPFYSRDPADAGFLKIPAAGQIQESAGEP